MGDLVNDMGPAKWSRVDSQKWIHTIKRLAMPCGDLVVKPEGLWSMIYMGPST